MLMLSQVDCVLELDSTKAVAGLQNDTGVGLNISLKVIQTQIKFCSLFQNYFNTVLSWKQAGIDQEGNNMNKMDLDDRGEIE